MPVCCPHLDRQWGSLPSRGMSTAPASPSFGDNPAFSHNRRAGFAQRKLKYARASIEGGLARALSSCSLLHFLLLLCRSDEPLSDVIVRLLQARVAGIEVHTRVVHFQVQVRNLLTQVIPILVLVKLLA
jgi:hypothetical protein